jgi:hypothetical protein
MMINEIEAKLIFGDANIDDNDTVNVRTTSYDDGTVDEIIIEDNKMMIFIFRENGHWCLFTSDPGIEGEIHLSLKLDDPTSLKVEG